MRPSYFEMKANAENALAEEYFIKMATFLMGQPSSADALRSHLRINNKYLVELIDINKSFLDISLNDPSSDKQNKVNEIVIGLNQSGLLYLRKQLLSK